MKFIIGIHFLTYVSVGFKNKTYVLCSTSKKKIKSLSMKNRIRKRERRKEKIKKY